MTYVLPLSAAELDLLVEMAHQYLVTNLGSETADVEKVILADQLAQRILGHKAALDLEQDLGIPDFDKFNKQALRDWVASQNAIAKRQFDIAMDNGIP